MISRRAFFAAVAAAAVMPPLRAAYGWTPLPPMTVYKSPSCGCCAKWVDHARAAGFTVKVHDTEDIEQVKRTMSIPDALASCHTVVVGAYLVEGHVPLDLVHKLLSEKPKGIRGLAVPGMPAGSPGMESTRKEAYDVMAFDRGGRAKLYARR